MTDASTFTTDQFIQPHITTAREDAPTDFMGIEEFAQRFGMNVRSTYRLASRGECPIPVIRVGKRMFFSRRAFDELLSAQLPAND